MATEYVTVGNYVSEDAARQAEAHLTEAGVADVELANPEQDLWRVNVPTPDRERAIDELRDLEAQVIRTHGPG